MILTVLPSGFTTKTLYVPLLPPYVLHTPPITSYALVHPHVWWTVKVMYFLRQYLAFPSHLTPLSFKYLSQSPQPVFFTQYGRPKCRHIDTRQHEISRFSHVILPSKSISSRLSFTLECLDTGVCASAVCL